MADHEFLRPCQGTKFLDVEMVQMVFEDLSTSGSVEERSNHIVEYTKVACDASMQRKGKIPSRRRHAY